MRLTRLAEQDTVWAIISHEDISERKLAEEGLRESEERFKLAIDASSDAIYDWNIATGFAINSPRWSEITGYPLEQLNYFSPDDAGRWSSSAATIHPDDLQRCQESFRLHCKRKAPTYSVEYRLRCASGEYK